MENKISSSEENKEMSELESLKKEVEMLKNKVKKLQEDDGYRPPTGAEKAAAYKARWKARM